MLKIGWSPAYCHPLPPGHRFPMEKYNLLPDQLMYEGTITSGQLFTPAEVTRETATLAHTTSYWDKLNLLRLSPQEIRRTGFPLSESLVQREKIIMQGTVDAALYALEHGAAMNIAGGTHHAFTHKGEGFCLMNDIAIAARYLLEHGHAQKILVVDLDVHQGNGTAEIFKEDERVFTFSMHGKKNFPFHKEQSDCDVELEDGTDDNTYLTLLYRHLNDCMEVANPDFIFYQCGVDVLASDALGKLSLTVKGCRERDRQVIELAHKNNIPLCGSMGGGYSPRLADIIEAHANTYRLLQEIVF